jgi:hypothetical protein
VRSQLAVNVKAPTFTPRACAGSGANAARATARGRGLGYAAGLDRRLPVTVGAMGLPERGFAVTRTRSPSANRSNASEPVHVQPRCPSSTAMYGSAATRRGFPPAQRATTCPSKVALAGSADSRASLRRLAVAAAPAAAPARAAAVRPARHEQDVSDGPEQRRRTEQCHPPPRPSASPRPFGTRRHAPEKAGHAPAGRCGPGAPCRPLVQPARGALGTGKPGTACTQRQLGAELVAAGPRHRSARQKAATSSPAPAGILYSFIILHFNKYRLFVLS